MPMTTRRTRSSVTIRSFSAVGAAGVILVFAVGAAVAHPNTMSLAAASFADLRALVAARIMALDPDTSAAELAAVLDEAVADLDEDAPAEAAEVEDVDDV